MAKPQFTDTTPSGNATERIVSAISEAIVGHRLQPGTKLTEQKLADMFGVSRTIVRQALARLARDKLVVLEEFKGACVAAPSVEEARQVFATRRLIEAVMVEQLANQITPAQIKTLRKHNACEQAALRQVDVPGRTRLLGDFHQLLAQMLGNQVLTEIITELVSRTSVVSMLYQSNRSAQCSSHEHTGLIEALAQKNAKRCAQLLRQHLDNVETNLRLDPRSNDLPSLLNLPPLPYAKVSKATKAVKTATGHAATGQPSTAKRSAKEKK